VHVGDLVDGGPVQVDSVQAPPGKAATFNHVVGINNLTFQKFGGYTFPIFINRDLKRTVELDVMKAEGPADSPRD